MSRAARARRILAAPVWTLAWLASTPGAARACATCISSPWGDRTYNWAYFGLLALPFLLTAAVGGILAHRAGWRPRLPRARRPLHRSKETT